MNRPLQILVLCTGNSARSQIAAALLNHRGAGRIVAESAGTNPAPRVNPFVVQALAAAGIRWLGHEPQGLAPVLGREWDLVITVCDKAKESCPVFPGRTMTAHWGMPDPAEVQGTDAEKLAAFRGTLSLLSRRVDLMLALPTEKLEWLALQQKVRDIARET